MHGFFEELRRRKVYRVAAAYAVVAWFLIQFSATVFPIWELPAWSLRLVIVCVLCGFPVALLCGWAFDVTSSGIHTTPSPAPRHALLGLIYAGLGRCREAKAEGDRAIELLPETKDAFDGPIMQISRARVALACGDAAAALQLLNHSLATPAGIAVQELRFDPMWDSLRTDPPFQKLLAKYSVAPQ